MRAHVASLLLASLLPACESVPDISFAGDGAVDTDAASDAPVADSDTDVATGCHDAGADAPPLPATEWCCNGWACGGGFCSVMNCNYCAMNCSAALPICCTKMGGNPQCKAAGGPRCP